MINITEKFIKTLYSNKIKGCTRITLFLANKMKSLQSIPVEISGGAILYADLRLMSAHCVFLGWTKGAEDEVLISNLLLPGETAFDIGTHVGLYSLLMSQIVGTKGKVYSFEVNPEVLPALKMTIDLRDNTTLFPYGLSDKTEQTFLYVPGDPSAASLANWTKGELGKVHKVKCELRRLDDLVESENFPFPDFIKIDVEGAEALVFKGAEKTLNREDAPIIFFELSAPAQKGFGLEKSSSMNFLRKLEKPGYSFYSAGEDGTKLTLVDDEIPSSGKNPFSVDIIAVPKSRMSRIERYL